MKGSRFSEEQIIGVAGAQTLPDLDLLVYAIVGYWTYIAR